MRIELTKNPVSTEAGFFVNCILQDDARDDLQCPLLHRPRTTKLQPDRSRH